MTVVKNIVCCILCNGALPGEKDEIFLNHMQEQHRSYFNLDFMFASFLLSPEQLSLILDSMNIISNKSALEETEVKKVRSKLMTFLGEPNNSENDEEHEDNAKMFQEIEESLGLESTDTIQAKLEPIVKLEQMNNNRNESDTIELKTIKDENEKLKKQLKKEKSKNKKQKIISKSETEEDEMKFNCYKCSDVFKTEKAQTKHLNKCHQEESEPGKIFDCNQCKYVFKTKKAQRKHLNNQHQDSSGICPDCGKNFENKYYLTTHRRFVHDEETHICDLCSKEIKGLAMLKLHKRRFHKEKEECNLCGKMVRKLKIHVLRIHTDNDQKGLKCDQCGKGFIDKVSLKEHSYTHMDVKPITCSEPTCSMTFTSRGNQKKHFLNKH